MWLNEPLPKLKDQSSGGYVSLVELWLKNLNIEFNITLHKVDFWAGLPYTETRCMTE